MNHALVILKHRLKELESSRKYWEAQIEEATTKLEAVEEGLQRTEGEMSEIGTAIQVLEGRESIT